MFMAQFMHIVNCDNQALLSLNQDKFQWALEAFFFKTT